MPVTHIVNGAPLPFGRRLALLGGLALGYAPPSQAATPERKPNEPAWNDGFGEGIYFPDTIYLSNNQNLWIALASGFARLASNGPQHWTCSDPRFYFLGAAGTTLAAGSFSDAGHPGLWQNDRLTSIDIVITVTDGTTTLSKKVRVINTRDCVYYGSNVLLDTSRTNYYGTTAKDPSHVARVEFGMSPSKSVGPIRSVVEKTGTLQLDANNNCIVNNAAASPISAHPGIYYVTIDAQGLREPETFPVWIIREQPAYLKFIPTGKLYTHVQAGEDIGKLAAFSDSGVTGFVVTASDDAIFVNTYQQVILKAPFSVVGKRSASVRVTSGNGKVTDTSFTYEVLAGTLLPPENMTLAVNPSLDNFEKQQSVGTPKIKGLTGTPVWSCSHIDDMVSNWSGTPLDLFLIDRTTGHVSARAQLPHNDHGPLTVSVTDGPNRCIQHFTIPVAWRNGPTLHVGRGMSAAHRGFGFETIADLVPNFINNGQGMNPKFAGATILVYADADPNYYNRPDSGANDTRYGVFGPFKWQGVAANGVSQPRVGGTVGKINAGYDTGGKGFWDIQAGDCIIDNFELSWVNGGDYGSKGQDNSHGVSGIRKNSDQVGDLTITNSYIHDCNNGVEIGDGPCWVTFDRCIIANFGTAYVGSGATHGIYCGITTKIMVMDCLIHRGNNGHNIKSRARNGVIQNSRIYDGENGSASNLIDIPEAGQYLIDSNHIMKGPSLQNPYAIQYGEETYYDSKTGSQNRYNNLTISNNTIMLYIAPGSHSGDGAAVGANGYVSNLDGAVTTVKLINNKFYLGNSKAVVYYNPLGQSTPIAPVKTDAGSTFLKSPPALDFTDPRSGFEGLAPRPGFLSFQIDQTESFANFNNLQIDLGADDIRVSHTAPPGTVIGHATAYGAAWWQSASATDPRIQPFTEGTVFTLVNVPQHYGNHPWAPAGRYAIDASTGLLTVAGVLPSAGTLDYIVVRATSPHGAIADGRRYVAVT